MAEFCLDCVNKYVIHGKSKLKSRDVILSDALCELCGEIKPCVITIKRRARYKYTGRRKWYQFWRR